MIVAMFPAMMLVAAGGAGPAGFEAIGPLIGHCWRGTLPDGSVDTHCFAADRAGATVRDRHVVRRRGRPVYRGETVYTLDGAGVRWAYGNARGPVMAGGVSAAPGEVRFTVDGGPPLVWRWRDERVYAAQVGPRAVTVLFRRLR